jgi:prepilin-type N-terminal cleavage/methylation domain-containing protein
MTQSLRLPTTPRRRFRSGGFTVVELLVSLAIVGVVFTVFAVVISNTVRDGGEVREDAVLQGEVRAAIDRLAQDLRQAYTGDGTPPILQMTGTQLTFLSPDRTAPFQSIRNRKIAYQLSSGQLERAIVTSSDSDGPPWSFGALGPWSPQFGSIRNSTVFAYFNADGGTATTAADVDSVTVTVKVSTATSTARQFTYSTSIALRAGE